MIGQKTSTREQVREWQKIEARKKDIMSKHHVERIAVGLKGRMLGTLCHNNSQRCTITEQIPSCKMEREYCVREGWKDKRQWRRGRHILMCDTEKEMCQRKPKRLCEGNVLAVANHFPDNKEVHKNIRVKLTKKSPQWGKRQRSCCFRNKQSIDFVQIMWLTRKHSANK